MCVCVCVQAVDVLSVFFLKTLNVTCVCHVSRKVTYLRCISVVISCK